MTKDEALKLALVALENAVRYHGIMLMSDPPQAAWKYHRVEDNAKQAITAIKKALAQPVQPVQEPVGYVYWSKGHAEGAIDVQTLKPGTPLYTSPTPQRKPLTDDVLVPLEILEAAASSLDSFCGDLGWGDADLQNMDNLFALISQHKAAYNIKEKTND